MGQYLVSYPDIPDSDLVFDEAETRSILGFFYPEAKLAIEPMEVTVPVRRLAQTMLIAAIDGTYAMGFVEATLRSARPIPSGSLKSWVQRLARGIARHWFKHARESDLRDVRIYDTVRDAIAASCRAHFRMAQAGQLSKMRMPAPSYLTFSSINALTWA
jgi:hypothetical protein